jgi:polysaccharide biosynthesis transport protein
VSVGQVLAILLRQAWILVLTLLSAGIGAWAVMQFTPGRYEAHATATVDPRHINPVSGDAEYYRSADLMQGNVVALVASEQVALDVVKRLNLAQSPLIQQSFRRSSAFGRETIEHSIANGLRANLDPTFDLGTDVLDIGYTAPDPSQAALLANAFLAAAVDASVAIKAAEAEQTARWFAPQLEGMRKELDEARAALTAFQAKENMVAPSTGADPENDKYMAIGDQLSNARGALTALQSRLASNSTDLSNDPSDPDLQILAVLKQKLTTAEGDIAAAKGVLGADNPKMIAQRANLAAARREITEATEKMRQHLKERIETVQTQIGSLEAQQQQAQKSLIEVQAQRDRLSQLQRDVEFRASQLNARENAAAAAKLKSKLTFSAMTVLDKAAPPVAPAFPNPFVALPVAISAGLALGLILALLKEAADRRVRFPVDLEYSVPGPFLGVLERARPSRPRIGASRRRLGPA